MGRPTLLEGLCGHALSLGAQSIEVECNDERQWVFANRRDTRPRIANYKASGPDANEFAWKSIRRRQEADPHRYRRTDLHPQSRRVREFWRRLFCGKHKFGAKGGSVNCAAIHRQARLISGLHLQLYQDPPPSSGRVGPGALLPCFPTHDPRNEQETLERNGPIEKASPHHSRHLPTGLLVATVKDDLRP